MEKDYWITLVLQRLSTSRFRDEAVFKGGTSLSKGYELINRFSEDIDFVVFRSDLGFEEWADMDRSPEERRIFRARNGILRRVTSIR